jgi:uncharacterized protein YcbX
MIKLTGLFVYPVKSCGGTSLDHADVGPRGIRQDREWMVVDAATGEFLTQREHPRLALVRPSLTAGGVTLAAPGFVPLEVPVDRRGPSCRVRVWDDRCHAVGQGDAAAAWLSQWLGASCRLVRMSDDFRRDVDPDYAIEPTDQVGFADGFPFLLISEESLADLNARLAAPLPMTRFRPNLVIRGAGEPFAEDRMHSLQLGDVVFDVVKPCGRCVTTTVDQATAETGREPLATLATFRKSGSKVLFGQNLIHRNQGIVRLGDEVIVREWK